MDQHQVQCGIVFHQRMVLIVPDELHYRSEGEGVGETVLPVVVVNLDQLVMPLFPISLKKIKRQKHLWQ